MNEGYIDKLLEAYHRMQRSYDKSFVVKDIIERAMLAQRGACAEAIINTDVKVDEADYWKLQKAITTAEVII